MNRITRGVAVLSLIATGLPGVGCSPQGGPAKSPPARWVPRVPEPRPVGGPDPSAKVGDFGLIKVWVHETPAEPTLRAVPVRSVPVVPPPTDDR